MNLGFGLVWCLTAAGMAKLLAIGENVVHGYGWSRGALQRVRATHNLLLVAYPLVTLFGLGVSGPRLMWQNDWSTLPVWGALWLTVGLIGAVALLASTIRHLTYRPPSCETSSTSEIIDIAARTNAPLIGSGRAKWLARLPGNEQFTLEVQRRTYRLPRLPAAWDGLSLAHFSDCHFRGPVTREYFVEVMRQIEALQADMILFTGDLLDAKACLGWLPETFGRLSAPLGCWFVLGNHDWYVGIEPEIRLALGEAGWTDVAGRVHGLERDGAPLVLCGNERPWMGQPPDLAEVDPAAFRILLSHGPDQITWARANNIDLMLAGHTHGGQIRLPIIGPVYSPSRFSCRYASGVFHVPPTLMSVTRGVSGREPIRYNCRPEITKITLHCGQD